MQVTEFASVGRDLPYAKEKIDAVYRRVTWRLIPLLFICNVLAFLDRINIGYAHLQMKHDLALSDAAYGLGASAFFIGYLMFEVPSNLLLERIGARKTIFRIMFLWGLTSAAMMFVETPLQFAAVRFLLGVFEAGFFPGMVLYLTYWFPSARRSGIMGVLLTSVVAAGLIAGPLSTGIMTKLDDVMGLQGWQWMFVLEGLPSSLLAFAVLLFLPNRPSDATWLTDEEKNFIVNQIKLDERGRVTSGHKGLRDILRNPLIYVLVVINFAVLAGGYTLNFWFPSLMRGFGITDIMQIGIYAVIPNLCGAIAMVWWGRRSDRKLERRWHFAVGAWVAAFGFAATTFQNGYLAWSLFALSIAFVGQAAITPLFWSVPTAILDGRTAAAGIALVSSLSNFGPLLAPSMIGIVKTTTGSMSFGLYAIAVLLVMAGALMVLAVPKRSLHETRAG